MKTKFTYILRFLLVMFAIAIMSSISAQTTLPKAEQQMDKFEYQKAIQMYLEHFDSNTPNAQDIRNITFCYMSTNDTKSAVDWLSKLIKTDFANSEDVKIYADLLKEEGRYSEAKFYYQKYAELDSNGKDYAEKNIEACDLSLAWTYEPEYFDVFNVQSLNSDKSDFGLIPFMGKFVLTSDRIDKNVSQKDLYGWTGNPYLKMYSVDFKTEDNSVSEIESIENLNKEFHNGPAVFDEKSNTLYYTKTKTVKKTQKPVDPDPTSWFVEASDEIYTNRLAIYSSKYENGEWSDPVAFENNNTAMFSVGHPALSADGKIMYFVSDMPGGQGMTDIWYSEKKDDGTWGDPRNAGKKINTAGKEMFPYIDANGDLYFSSNGLPGMGGLDLFKASGQKKSWSEPENLKYPINSPKDDFAVYFTKTGEAGYFSSNRYGGQGSDDIYSFAYSPPTEIILAVTTKEILEDGTLALLEDVSIDVIDNNDEVFASLDQFSPGLYYGTLDCNQHYTVKGTKDEYFSQSTSVETICETKNDTVYVELIFEKIVIDKPIVIENIYYDFDKWNIRPDAAVELDKIVELLQENPDIIIELGSHTDARGSDKYNENLSQKRAESAVQYIIDNGISKDRITAKGYGEYVPVNECVNGVYCSEEDHQLNRRTEFKVTGFSEKQPVIYSAKD